jgi:HK97 family phage major capsid protein
LALPKLGPKAQQAIRDYVRNAVYAELEPILAKASEPASNVGELILKASNPNMFSYDEKRGLGFAQMVRCMALGGGNPEAALRISKQLYGDSSRATNAISKAMAAGDMTAGGFLVPQDFADEVIDLLRPLSVVRAIQPNVVRIPRGQKDFPVLTTSATANYVGENQDIPLSEPTFGNKAMSAKKLTGLAVMSNELLRFSNELAERTVREDLLSVIATAEDINLLRGPGTQNTPMGIRNQIAETNVLSSNGTTASNIEDDFKDLKNALDIANVRMRRPQWLMHPSRFNHLLTLRDANGNLIFPELRTANPTIHTIPVKTTTNIPADLGGGAQSEIYLLEASEVDFGEVEGIQIQMSGEASYTDFDQSAVSTFVRDQTLVRAILHHDIMLRHDVGVAVIADVAWGA